MTATRFAYELLVKKAPLTVLASMGPADIEDVLLRSRFIG
jgi:hypothetical protein